MDKIKIITDSTCDLSKDILEKLDIEVVPLTVNIDSKSYVDGVDINFKELNKIILECGDFPTTSPPNPDVFKEVYEKYLTKGYKIISIHISSKFSFTCQSAFIAKDILETQDIYIYDSLNLSSGLAMIVVEAAEMVKNGCEFEEICKNIGYGISNVKSIAIVNDMSNLIISGKVNKTLGKISKLTRMKVIIGIVDGEVTFIGKIIRKRKILDYLINFLELENLDDSSIIYIAHSDEDELTGLLKNYLEKNQYKYYSINTGCVVGAYSGSKSLGISIKCI